MEVTGILSKYELDYLTGKVQLDGKEAINARYRIKKKVESLQQLIPLLEKHGFSIDNQLEMSSLAKTDQALLRVIRPLGVSVELPVSMPIIHIIPSIPFFHELIKSDEFWSEDENPPHFEKAALAQL